MKLLDFRIEKLRRANDSASTEDVMKNQGAIREHKQLIQSIRRSSNPAYKSAPTIDNPLGL